MLDALTHLFFDVKKVLRQFSPGLEVNQLPDKPRQVKSGQLGTQYI